LAYRLADNGLGIDASSTFDPKGKESQALLKALSPAGRTSSLAGLPDAPGVIGALSLIGSEDLSGEVARVLAGAPWLGVAGAPGPIGALSLIGSEDLSVEVARVLAVELWLGMRWTPDLLPSDTDHIRRILGDLYSRLKVGRGALYQVRDKGRGQLAVVAVLEP